MRKKITCTYIVRNVWQTIRIINREILGAKGLKIIPKEEINLSKNELFPLVWLIDSHGLELQHNKRIFYIVVQFLYEKI